MLQAVLEDDQIPMQVESTADLEKVVASCWLRKGQGDELLKSPLPLNLPFSHVFYVSCTCVRPSSLIHNY